MGPEHDLSPRGAWDIYFVIALSGMSALGAEVVWTRLLSLLLGGTVYTFSIILAVLLVGLAIGSSVGALIAGGTVQCAASAGDLPVASDRRHCVDGIHDRQIIALLADQSADGERAGFSV